MEAWCVAWVLLALPQLCQAADCLPPPCAGPVCEYRIKIERRPSLTINRGGETYNVGLNSMTGNLELTESCFHPAATLPDPLILTAAEAAQVNTLDGHQRDIVTINGKHPGPTINVMHNVQVVVHVINNLFQDSLTVHWHGIHQRYNLWMDGVPFLTQCPVLAGTCFIYTFYADPVGTHWYHSHLEQQRMDGLQGMIIVHPIMPTYCHFAVAAQDWMEVGAEEHKADNPDTAVWTRGPGNYFQHEDKWRTSAAKTLYSIFPFSSIIVNGMGRRPPYTDQWPLETFHVTLGNRYRFHVAHAGQEAAMRVSVDGHDITVVLIDDGDIQSIPVESFIIFSGVAIDFELVADQGPGSYWMRFTTLGVLDINGNPVTPYEGRAIIRYSGSDDPTSSPVDCPSEASPCKVFNCAWEKYPDSANRECIPVADAQSTHDMVFLNEEFGLDQEPDTTFVINFNEIFEHDVNGHTFVFPCDPFTEDGFTPCDPADCADGCACTYFESVDYNDVVRLVLTDYEDFTANKIWSVHPVHIHGNSFAVLKQGFAPVDPVTGQLTGNNPDVVCNPSNCIRTQWVGSTSGFNTVDPPIVNTVIIPPQGYTVVQFRAKNPGYWIMHCHILRHSEEGMIMAIRVGQKDQLPDIPNDMPRCTCTCKQIDNFTWYIQKLKKKLSKQGRKKKGKSGKG